MFQGLWPINSDMPPLCVPTHILKLHFNPNDTPVMFHDYCSTDKTQYVPLDTQTPAKILNITNCIHADTHYVEGESVILDLERFSGGSD